MAVVFSINNLKYLLKGLEMTLAIASISFLLCLIVGTIVAMIRNYCNGKLGFLKFICTIYVELFRCTPTILWILILRFSISGSALKIGLISFTLTYAPYVSEIIRGGLNSIPKGQIESAASQGFNFIQTLRYIILPQTFKLIIGALFSQATTIIKDTSFLNMIDTYELMHASNAILVQVNTVSGIFTMYFLVFAIYFVVNFSLSYCVRQYQRRNRLIM